MPKIADAVEKIAQAVTQGYKKIENGAVGGFTRISDKCVEVLFTREGETVEEAKKRLAAHK